LATSPSKVKNSDMASKKATRRAAFLCCVTRSLQGWQKLIGA
jgi:hypothetical protein